MALDLPASYQKIETCEIVIFFLKIFADLSLIKHRFLTIFQKMIYKNTTVNHIFSILCLYLHFLKYSVHGMSFPCASFLKLRIK